MEDTEENRDIWDLLSEEKVEKLRQSNPPHVFIKIMERLLKEAVREYRGYNLVKAKEYSERLRKLLEAYNTREDDLKTDITIVGLIAFSQEMVESESYAKKNNKKLTTSAHHKKDIPTGCVFFVLYLKNRKIKPIHCHVRIGF